MAAKEKPKATETRATRARSTAVATWQDFQSELESRETDIALMMPPHIAPKKLTASAVAAVKHNPDLLKATPRSLFNSITKAAQDGLMPDGREGVITVYREKDKHSETYSNIAQWNPMAYGLRKRARELDGIIIDAQVVYENDEFVWEQGDDPRLVHKPARLGVNRGEMIGAYAIFKNAEEGILHREVMAAEEIEKVRSQSKSPNGLMWTKFKSEGYRKTVVRRGIKSVPCSPSLETILRRDDETFQFDEATDIPSKLDRRRAPPAVIQGTVSDRALPPTVADGNKQADYIDVDPGDEDENAKPETESKTAVEEPAGGATSTDQAAALLLEQAVQELKDCGSQEELEDVAKKYREHPGLQFPPDKAALEKVIKKTEQELAG